MIEFSDMNSVISSVAGVFLVEVHAVSGGQEGLSRCGLMGNQVLARVNKKTVVQLGSSSSWFGIVRSRLGAVLSHSGKDASACTNVRALYIEGVGCTVGRMRGSVMPVLVCDDIACKISVSLVGSTGHILLIVCEMAGFTVLV